MKIKNFELKFKILFEHNNDKIVYCCGDENNPFGFYVWRQLSDFNHEKNSNWFLSSTVNKSIIDYITPLGKFEHDRYLLMLFEQTIGKFNLTFDELYDIMMNSNLLLNSVTLSGFFSNSGNFHLDEIVESEG